MLPFNPLGRARFSYRADFTRDPFANLSFYDLERREIPFHLSLRAPEGLAVCNRRGAGESDWGREIPRPVRFAPGGTRVDILFQDSDLRVEIDGRELFRFRPGLFRSRFPGLDRIGFVDFQGGIPASAIDMDIRDAEAGDGLTLTQRLDLRGWLDLSSSAAEGLRLEAGGTDQPLTLIARPAPGDRGGTELRAILPGRVWRGVEPSAPLRLSLRGANGAVLDRLDITRDQVARHIAALLRGGDLAGDTQAATQVIEHARFAGLSGRLSPQIRARLGDTAAFFGLEDFLWPPAREPAGADETEAAGETGETAPARPPAAALPAPDPDIATLTAAQARAAEALRAAGPDGDLDAALDAATETLPRRLKWDFYVSLSDWFCLHDRFDTLFAHAHAAGTRDFRRSDNGWFNSGVLPFLFRQGDFAVLREVMWKLSTDTESWIQTAPLGWTIQRALDTPGFDARDLDDMLYAFTDFVDKRMWDYWNRTPCRALVGAAVALLAHYDRLADYTRDHIDWFIPRAYGLSRQFWDAVTARGLTLAPQLDAAHRAWTRIAGHLYGTDPAEPAALSAALSLFERAGCADTMRYRREILGPTGLNAADGTPPGYLELMQTGLRPGEAAIRHLAFPDTPPAGPGLTRAAREAMAAAYPTVPRAPHYALQGRASRSAAAILARCVRTKTEPDTGEIDDVLLDLAPLSNSASGFVGFGIGIGLMQGLLRCGLTGTAAHLRRELQGIRRRLPDWDRDGLAASTALVNALYGLRPLAAADGSAGEIARKVLASFPRALRALPAPPAADAAPLGPASPLFDTLVTVFSCKPNLDTRIPAMRAGWLGQLAALGIPYVVVVGEGDGRLDGDVVHLEAPDDYEGLPLKTLATIRWVHDNTGFTHLLKIDDDCFLNPDEYFHSQSYRKFDYYGRTLTRVVGQLDRAWHCAKSGSARGQLELDKSPEPSSYCDGGSGYALSRRAMAAALDAADSPEGQALTAVSFMEDKLLGDLLSMRDIWPANEDYRITVRRRENPRGIPVPRWLNGFDASAAAPVKLVHLDTHTEQKAALEKLSSPTLTPKKIWPSYQDVVLVEDSNALEMITPPDRLDAAREAPVAVVACMRNEMFMLPHFLDHYRAQGVESFLIADNCSDDGTLEYLADQPDVALFSVDTAYRLSHYGVAWQQALISAFRVGRWSLMADADELLVWEKTRRASLPELLAGDAFAGADAVRLFMLDMYPEGPLHAADFKAGSPFEQAGHVDRVPFLTGSTGYGPFSDRPTWTSALRHRLIPGSRNELFVAQKLALLKYRPWMRLSAGLHYVADVRLADRELLFAHFKYNADFRRKAMAEVARRQHFNDAEEYRKYLTLVSEGRDLIFDPEISVPWEDCDFVRARMTAG